MVARSGTKVEYRELTHTTFEVFWIESILQELSMPHLPLTPQCDNHIVVMVLHNPILHVRTKYIELDINFVREIVAANKLQIQHVPAQTHIVNILTRSLPTNLFVQVCDKLKIFCFKAS